jgi:hypothetical protein
MSTRRIWSRRPWYSSCTACVTSQVRSHALIMGMIALGLVVARVTEPVDQTVKASVVSGR